MLFSVVLNGKLNIRYQEKVNLKNWELRKTVKALKKICYISYKRWDKPPKSWEVLSQWRIKMCWFCFVEVTVTCFNFCQWFLRIFFWNAISILCCYLRSYLLYVSESRRWIQEYWHIRDGSLSDSSLRLKTNDVFLEIN